MDDGGQAMAKGDWWALARSDEVTSVKPLGVQCGAHEIALYRNASGQAFALEDRCVHRRAPMSLGRITPEGWLQCGYHGWCYDGETGTCKKIPNLKADERISPRYRIEPYQVEERDDFVHVWIGAGAAPASAPPPEIGYQPQGRQYQGTALVALAHDEFVAALLDGPGLVLDFAGVRPVNWPLGDPTVRGDQLSMDRGAQWMRPNTATTRAFGDTFTADYPLIVRVNMHAPTGRAWVQVRTPDQEIISAAVIAPAPAARGVTAVRWRSCAPAGAKGVRAGLVRAAAQAGLAPIRVRPSVDGEALAKLIVGVSQTWRHAVRAPADLSVVA